MDTLEWLAHAGGRCGIARRSFATVYRCSRLGFVDRIGATRRTVMSTHAARPRAHEHVGLKLRVTSQSAWLAIGLVVAFAVPFLLADQLAINRDLFYGLYALAVFELFWLWTRSTGYDFVATVRRRWLVATLLGLAAAGVLAVMVVRTEAATARPTGLDLVGALLWRGVVYGATDGFLLSVFPILVVFAAFAGSRLDRRFAGKIAIGLVALVASLAMTAVYHFGYSDFRSSKVRKPLTGDLVWSVPTLLTLNPVGSPIAHVGLHVSAVLHSYQTDTFLPPHK
jgi:hypothetical protein